MSCWACSENERKAIWCEPVDDARTLWMVFAPPVPGEFKPRALAAPGCGRDMGRSRRQVAGAVHIQERSH